MESYISGHKGVIDNNLKTSMNSQQLIGILKKEYLCHKVWKQDTVNQATSNHPSSSKPALAAHIMDRLWKTSGKYCKLCKCKNHNTDKCHHLGGVKCHGCGKFRHTEDDCWFSKKKGKQGNKRKGKKPWKNKPKKDEANTIEEVTFVAEDSIKFNTSEEQQYFNFGNHTVSSAEGIDECIIYYDWFADSATPSHISNQ